MNEHASSKFSWTLVLMITLALSNFAFGGEVHYAAGFAPEKLEFTLGEPIYLAFNLTNTGSKAALLEVSGNQWGITGPYRIQVFDSSGAKVPDEYGNGNFAVSTVGGMTEIKGGSVYVDRLNLPTFVKFKESGEYTLVASRWIGLGQLPESFNLLYDGALSSRDGLNWVDTFLFSMPGDSIPYSFDRRLIPVSSSSVTNRFKLTVLPADPEGLLRRSREMLAKLDGIAARDVVAKPDGPRALDRTVDWSTIASAWHTCADNVDLAWAVQVLTDIGDRRIIPDLEKHLNDASMKVRFACVKVLCALGEPLRADWMVPIIKSGQWCLHDDPENFVARHGGADAAGMLVQCMHLTDPSVTNVWNYRLMNIIKKTQGPYYPYNYRETGTGTAEEIQENTEVLAQLQEWLKSNPVKK